MLWIRVCHVPTLLWLGLPEAGGQTAAFLRPLVALVWVVIGQDHIKLLEIWKAGVGGGHPCPVFAAKHSRGCVWLFAVALAESPVSSFWASRGRASLVVGGGAVYLVAWDDFVAGG